MKSLVISSGSQGDILYIKVSSFLLSQYAVVIFTMSLHIIKSKTLLLLDHSAKSLQSCPTLCDPMPGILQARTLEWVAISFMHKSEK